MNPHDLAERRVLLSAEFSRCSEKLGRIKAGRAIKWLELRSISKTDKEADRRWEASEEGQEEAILTYKCKGLEKEISSISTMLRVLDNEAHNLH